MFDRSEIGAWPLFRFLCNSATYSLKAIGRDYNRDVTVIGQEKTGESRARAEMSRTEFASASKPRRSRRALSEGEDAPIERIGTRSE